MKAVEKLKIAKDILEQELSEIISFLSIDFIFKRLNIKFHNGINIYIVYNNYDEYSYSILFSKLKLDRYRFDNYDDRWNVSSKPHHFHPRNAKEAIESKMTGLPEKDMIYLVDFLKSKKII
ncbi:MAG: hypothetical protein JXA99_14455 [Candidatus Lokiarchaeota archaeon]|nr:hypothetical protein [Candidatus Lokiarchaeota archaeon]